jgi:hypothetical protein
MFTGGRDETSVAPMIDALARLRNIEDGRADLVHHRFVETRLATRILDLCRRALVRQALVFIYGDSQIGKTTALQEYVRRAPRGQTLYIRMPAGGALPSLLRKFSTVLGIPAGRDTESLKTAIRQCLDTRTLLIVDECEECLRESPRSTQGTATLHFLRELHDEQQCGMVLAGANTFRERLHHGCHSQTMQRLVRRGLPPLRLPSITSRADLALFASRYGLPPIPDADIGVRLTETDDDGNEKKITLTANPLSLQTQVNREHGLGRWLLILQDASDAAREGRKTPTWGYVIRSAHQCEPLQAIEEKAEGLKG